MMTTITSLPQRKTIDLPAFSFTSSDTLATWSIPEEGAITSQVNRRVHIGIFRNAHINQYVFCGDNPVMFGDPWGLDTIVIYGRTDAQVHPSIPNIAAGTILKPGTISHVFPSDNLQDAVSQVVEWSKQNPNVAIDGLVIIGHNRYGPQQIGNSIIQPRRGCDEESLRTLGNSVSASAPIYLMGCSVAAGSAGKNYCQRIANISGHNVTAYSSRVYGKPTPGGTTKWSLRWFGSPYEFTPQSTGAK